MYISLIFLAQAVVPLCATAGWNATATTAAGAISNPGATATLISGPYNVAFDEYRNMYVVDYNNHRIQRFRFGKSNEHRRHLSNTLSIF